MSEARKLIRWEWVRRGAQLLVLATFVTLSLLGPQLDLGLVPVQSLSRINPLVGLTLSLASRTFVAYAGAAVVTVFLTLILGRAWCGWVCPVGGLLDILPGRKREKDNPISKRWRFVKHGVLAIVLGAALLGSLGPMVLDPITIVTRPLQELAMPAVGTSAMGLAIGDDLSRGAIGMLAVLSAAPLVIILALNAFAKRFWCRALCPLGSLLGLSSLIPGIRRRVDAETCTSCGKCARECPTQAISAERGFATDATECIDCMHCVDICPPGATSFRHNPPVVSQSADGVDRRDAVLLMGATGFSLAATVVVPRSSLGSEVLRPPSTSEDRLAQLCVRCGACYSACPTGALHPSTSFTQEAGLWTPMLDERPDHCSMDCNLCADVCPTDALHVPTEQEAALMGLGAFAAVDRTRCSAWAKGWHCMACQGVCPILGAITSTVESNPSWRKGGQTKVPHVNRDLCVACGLCSGVCPVGPPAIMVGHWE